MPKKVKTDDVAVATTLPMQIMMESEKRKLLAGYVKDNMVSGTDFYTLQIRGKESKPSLSKPGSEKVLSLFHWRAEFVKDTDTWEMLGSKPGILCYVCRLYTIKDNTLVGEGRGARDVTRENGDVNKTIKMAEKSAQIDAVLRTGGLSDLFTQDLEDMPQTASGVVVDARGAEDTQVVGGDAVDPVFEQRKLLKKILADRNVDVTSKEACEQYVAEITELALVPENYVAIIKKLEAYNI